MRLNVFDKSPDLRFESLFPEAQPSGKKKSSILHEPISAILVSIGAALSAVTGGIVGAAGIVVAGYLVSWGTVLTVIVIAFTLYSYVAAGKKGRTGRTGLQSIDESGQLINTRETSTPVKLIYGKAKVGGNWVFAEQSVADADLLNVVVSWGEGECDGIANSIDWMPLFTGTGYDDLHTGGEAIDTSTDCTCDESCYEYSGCTCNMTCHTESCDCDSAHYGLQSDPYSCTCDNMFYSCNSCYSACYVDGGW